MVHEKQELHLYPGEKRLLFVVDAKLVTVVEAWGGPPLATPKRPGEPFGATPTPTGRFRIGWVGPYRTPTWRWSKILWGSHLIRHPFDEKDLLFEQSGRWQSVYRTTSLSRHDVEMRYFQLYGLRGFPASWKFNDFGPIAVRFYRDKNNNRKRDANELLRGEMFHTTPENEAEGGNTALYESHGCIHLRPNERERLLKMNAFKKETLLVIHDYGETAGLGPREPAGAP